MSIATLKENLTPLMKQYEELKNQHPGEIVFFRLGDFYEIFGEDAKAAAPLLEVALTQRQDTPMCGVPHHAMARYVSKLLKKNFRVAIAEQMEDPALAKGIVRRQVVRVISPGTILEENLLAPRSNNFLMAAFPGMDPTGNKSVGLAALDVSTGHFLASEVEDGPNGFALANEIARINPAEVLLPQDGLRLPPGVPCQRMPPSEFAGIDAAQFFSGAQDLQNLAALRNHPLALEAVRMVLAYVQKMNPGMSLGLKCPQWTAHSETMSLDRETLDNLEIIKNNEDGAWEGTLLQFLDRTQTAMGARLLRQWLLRPLTRLDKIQERLATVDFFVARSDLRLGMRNALKGMLDLERLIVRVFSGQAGPRDLLGLKNSLQKAKEIRGILARPPREELTLSSGQIPGLLNKILLELGDFDDLISVLERAISEEPPISLEDSGAIKQGYHPALDEKRKASSEGKEWLAALETRERDATKISILKIGYTSVFGYYFEVTKSHLAKVPPHWHRKQTLVNAERFINEELKNLEQKILGAEEQALRIEKEIFREILEGVREKAPEVQKAARALAELDGFLSFAEVADLKGLVKPDLDESGSLRISEGWHPVVKEFLPSGSFVPNDVLLNGSSDQIIILTGPNMSGKSTYLRQIALTVLMAQAGSFVPAKKAQISLVDRIFTRIGSGDRLAQGQSTFMVEMKETARILAEATARSLVILDEVGRGTSTYDGISIAWAIIEHLNRDPRPKVLFATHYFELTHLAHELAGVKNYNVQAKEWQDSVLFLHKIAPGPADRSYGIHVAKLAGLPPSVIARAKKILKDLEKQHRSVLESSQPDQQEFQI